MQAESCKSINATTHLFCLKCKPPFGGMDHFGTYFRERKFTLITDHRPLEKLGKVHIKTKNRLQDVMNTYDFDIVYKKGSKNAS